MSILSSVLICNGTVAFVSNSAEGFGGGIIALFSKFFGSAVFTNNSATWGGGMHLWGSVLICNGTVAFVSNSAEKQGGGINAFYSSLKFYGNTTLMGNSAIQGGGMGIWNSVLICNGTVAFDSNRAEGVGGGIAATSGSLEFYGNTTLMDNSALQGGGGMNIERTNLMYNGTVAQFDSSRAESIGSGIGAFVGSSAKLIVVNNRGKLGGGIANLLGNLSLFGNIKFHNNSAYGAGMGYGGGIFSYYGILYLLGDTTFSGNTALEGGGVHGSRTTVIIDGRMNVVNNAAHASGGGFYLATGSECRVVGNTSLLLAHNHAGQFGGALYIQDDPFYQCVFYPSKAYAANCFLQPTKWPTTATIHILEDNYADEAGSGLYGGHLDYCRLEIWGNDLYNQNSTIPTNVFDKSNTEVFRWTFQNTPALPNISQSSFISSDPIRVCLCISNKPHCSITERQVTAFPGGTLYISIVATGQSNGTVPSVITAKLIDTETVIDSYQGVQSANKTCTTLEYRISPKSRFGTSINFTMTLHSESPCATPLAIIVHLLPCPKGFELSQTLHKSCICSKRVQQYTNTCDIDTQAILRHGQYWIGWDSTSNGAALHPHCPFDYCRSGNTSFPMNDTDRQCPRQE